MAGRNGNDRFNRFLLVIDIVLLLIGTLFAESIGKYVNILVLLLLGYIYFRMFSRDITKRREENEKYIRLQIRFSGWMRLHRERWIQRKDYKFFTCPSCRTTLRVPRGHGKIKIVCRKCGTSFMGKS